MLANINFLTGRPGLREPPGFFAADAAQNRQSIQALIALEPAVVCLGHGPPVRDARLLAPFAEPRDL